MVKPLLYERATSSCSFRIRLALNIAGIEYVHVSVTSTEGKGPEYRMKNPQGLVPLLVVGEDHLSQASFNSAARLLDRPMNFKSFPKQLACLVWYPRNSTGCKRKGKSTGSGPLLDRFCTTSATPDNQSRCWLGRDPLLLNF